MIDKLAASLGPTLGCSRTTLRASVARARHVGVQRRRDERGSVTLWLVIMTVAMFAGMGLVTDGGQAMATKGQAISDAYGAARAGAEALDQASFAVGGPPRPDIAGAQNAVAAFLSAAGVASGQYQVSVTAQEVTVTVHLSSPVPILAAIGVQPFHVSGQGSAQAVYGVRGPLP
jgi:hypothetical protein